MAMMDKQLLIKEVEQVLYDKLTAKDIDTVAEALISKLGNYTIERVSEECPAAVSEDLIRIFMDATQLIANTSSAKNHRRRNEHERYRVYVPYYCRDLQLCCRKWHGG